MAKLFVIQDRYNEEITNWYVFSNAAKAQSKFDELDDEREEDWQLESLNVSGPNCGFCIGFDDDMGEVFAEPVKDVSKYDGIGGFGRKNSTAYLFGPKSKEGKVMVGSYGELEYTGNLDVVAEWEESELMESKSTEKSLKHVKLFEQFITEKFVKEFDKAVLDAETQADILKVYPDAKFFIGKISHFFGELEKNLFFKAYYPKYYQEDYGKKIKGDFKITKIYSKKGGSYVDLYKESLNEGVNESELKIKIKGKTIKVDTSSIEIEGIDTRDYPDFSDAFITYAEDHRGKELSDEEIEFLNTEHYDIIGEIIFDRQLYMR